MFTQWRLNEGVFSRHLEIGEKVELFGDAEDCSLVAKNC